jgi:hypothetical protein
VFVTRQFRALFKETRYRQERSIKNYQDRPTSLLPPTQVGKNQRWKQRVRSAGHPLIFLGLATLGTGSPSRLRTGITDRRERLHQKWSSQKAHPKSKRVSNWLYNLSSVTQNQMGKYTHNIFLPSRTQSQDRQSAITKKRAQQGDQASSRNLPPNHPFMF